MTSWFWFLKVCAAVIASTDLYSYFGFIIYYLLLMLITVSTTIVFSYCSSLILKAVVSHFSRLNMSIWTWLFIVLIWGMFSYSGVVALFCEEVINCSFKLPFGNKLASNAVKHDITCPHYFVTYTLQACFGFK